MHRVYCSIMLLVINMKAYKKRLLFALTLAILISSMPIITTAASEFSDTSEHWARASIIRWSELGILNGYPDSTFRPDNPVTRGELSAIINNIMIFPKAPEDIGLFHDAAGKWYEPHINALALQGVYFLTHGEAKGDAFLTREEAAALIYNAFPIDYPSYPYSFSDTDDMEDGFADKINIMYNVGFLSGFPDGSFRPKTLITRAEVVTILSNMIDEYITEPGEYSGLEGKRVVVAVPDVEIMIERNMEYLAVSPNAGLGYTWVSHTARYVTKWMENRLAVRLGSSIGRETNRYIISYDARFSGGSGQEDHPYLISTQDQLELLREYLEYSGVRYRFLHFALANDIELKGEWTPIGYYSRNVFSLPRSIGFESTLDGNGFSISGLSITTDENNREAVGLFAYIDRGTVRNLAVSGEISYATTEEEQYVGGIFGFVNSSTVENCSSQVNISVASTEIISAGGISGLIEYSLISDCIASGSINALGDPSSTNSSAYAGGIAGMAFEGGTISGCMSNANVVSSSFASARAGGILGISHRWNIIGCDAEGEVSAISLSSTDAITNAGGIAGRTYSGRIEGCVSAAVVNSEAANDSYAGGITGYVSYPSSDDDDGLITIDSCVAYWEVNASTTSQDDGSYAGGITGSASRVRMSGCISYASITASGGANSFAGGLCGNLTRPIASLSFSIIEDSFSLGRVHARDAVMQNNAGGAVGQVLNSIAQRSGSGATVLASGNPVYFNAVGGFAGSMYEESRVSNCYSVGPVSCSYMYSSIGGFIGRVEGNVEYCYSASPIDAKWALNDYSFQGLIGTVRFGIETVNCGVFTGPALHFYDNESDPNGIITRVTRSDILGARVYAAFGWDMDDVWVMPDSDDNYSLPILRGSLEEAQRAVAMPSHIR